MPQTNKKPSKLQKVIGVVSFLSAVVSTKTQAKYDKEHARIAAENKVAFEKAWLDKYYGGVKPTHWDIDEE